jgi:hypothetical protein
MIGKELLMIGGKAGFRFPTWKKQGKSWLPITMIGNVWNVISSPVRIQIYNYMYRKGLSPPHTSALVARTCYSWQVGSTKFPRVRATFTAFSSFVTCKPNIKHVWYFSSFVTKKFSCAASKRQARLNRKICACVQLAELKTRHDLVILIRHVVFNSAS